MTVVGVLGAGQLGRMLALAGYPLGLRFAFFDESADAPAGHLGDLTVGRWDDVAALDDVMHVEHRRGETRMIRDDAHLRPDRQVGDPFELAVLLRERRQSHRQRWKRCCRKLTKC